MAGGPHVVDLRALRYTPDRLISYKLRYSGERQSLPRRPAGRSSGVWSTTKLYKQPLPIKKKFQHLQELKNQLPNEYHSLNDNLPLNRRDVRFGWLTRALLDRLSFLKTELFACRLPTSRTAVHGSRNEKAYA